MVNPGNFPTLTLTVIAGVGGSGAQVVYSGQAPDLVSGAVPLTLVVGGTFSTPA